MNAHLKFKDKRFKIDRMAITLLVGSVRIWTLESTQSQKLSLRGDDWDCSSL